MRKGPGRTQGRSRSWLPVRVKFLTCIPVSITKSSPRVAESVKHAIKAYEQTTSLPYDSVPIEVCRARDGTRSIDLATWSLLVDDVALRCIAAGDKHRIDELAAQSSVNKVLNTSALRKPL